MAREGARIVANDIMPEVAQETTAWLRARGYDAVAVPGDASQKDEAEAIVRQGLECFGHIDTVVNLAGRQFRWPVTEINLYDWNRQLEGFMTGGMLTTKYSARAMIETGHKGCIIHVISSAGHYGEGGNSGYSAILTVGSKKSSGISVSGGTGSPRPIHAKTIPLSVIVG
jgi:NAD(P)-dependent dehydrogenase (short-subunit alcohol dehydrogenase family)